MSEWQDPIESMNDYISDIVTGEILSCETVMGAINRHQRDLGDQNSDDFPYYFDVDHARNVLNFYPTLMRHSIGRDVGKPFTLLPWQNFAIGSLFGWKHRETHARRFTKAFISVARKSGKSTLAAAISHFMAGFDHNPETGGFENVAQVVLAATKKEQSTRVVFAEACRMLRQSEVLSSMAEIKNHQITYAHNAGHIFCTGSDKPADGLNPSMVAIDELHAFRSEGGQKEFLDTMLTGSGARVQPLILFITTAGNTASHVWIEQYKYAGGIARDEFRDESYFSLNYEMDDADDVFDEVNYIKANPCLGVTCQPEYLRDQMLPAMTDKLVENRWRRYHCNQMVTNTDAAFNLDEWDACAGELSDWKEADAIGAGVDIGGRDDLASFSLVARFDTGEMVQPDEDSEPMPIYRYEGRTWEYLAMDTERDTTIKPFVDFIDDGLIRTSKYPVSELEKDLVRSCYKHGCQEVAFDPYGAQKTGEYVESEGLIPMSMTQSCRMFNEPITTLRQLIKDGRFSHDGNPCLRWMIGNAVLIEDRNERVMYSKKDSAEKIDGVVSMTMALSRAMHAPPRTSGYFLT